MGPPRTCCFSSARHSSFTAVKRKEEHKIYWLQIKNNFYSSSFVCSQSISIIIVTFNGTMDALTVCFKNIWFWFANNANYSDIHSESNFTFCYYFIKQEQISEIKIRIRILVIDIQISEFKEFMLAKNSGNAGIDFLFSVHLFQIIQDILTWTLPKHKSIQNLFSEQFLQERTNWTIEELCQNK